ncbi:SLAIN motif-containing protein-like isoform X2 [Sander lucioperca]|uniref:SLAIN motif-containing protein-like isoform X2 n=1 Tax=Sander lucioperca TaxID=283035 RepID=UPI001653A4D6|nr:SLAIN motif-containing protein-like isoform X2 [Sander lucioperca]
MELQNLLKVDWSQYFCNRPQVKFDTSSMHYLLCSELKSSAVKLEGNSDPYCSIWADAKQARVKSCNNRSFAMDARIRLDNLKSGCNSPLPCSATDRMLFNYNFQKDLWDSEESQEEESVLDSVELIDVEDNVQDEESWLYESKKQVFVERSESALKWCRHVLDNPSPEMEAACRSLINRLDQRSSMSHFYRRPAVGSSTDKTSVSTTHNISDSSDNELSFHYDSMTTDYRLQDITDVHIMAQIQEASLRQDYVSMPARRSPESPVIFPFYFNTTVENIDESTQGYKTEASSSSCWQPGLSSLSSSLRQSSTPVAKQGCQSPKLARLHQQVTQFKLLKLAQNQATSPGRTRSPLRTSLRSLQAVRNSRCLDNNNWQSADQITYPPSAPSNSSLHSVRDSLDPTTAVKRLLRSQSLSPCRIPHPAKGYLSVNGCVFASPERSTITAWGRSVPFTQS